MMMIMACTMSKDNENDVKFTPLTLREIMANEGFEMEQDVTFSYLQHACREGLLFATDSMIKQTTQISFAHEYIRQATLECISNEEQMALSLRVFTSRLQKWNEHRLNDDHLCSIYNGFGQQHGQYRPTNKEGREMKALVELFDLVDPSSTDGGGNNRSLMSASMTATSHSRGAPLSKSMAGRARSGARNGYQQNQLSKSVANHRARGGLVSSISKMKLTASITESIKSPKDSNSGKMKLTSSMKESIKAPKHLIKLLVRAREA